jgi:hypothetical protein
VCVCGRGGGSQHSPRHHTFAHATLTVSVEALEQRQVGVVAVQPYLWGDAAAQAGVSRVVGAAAGCVARMRGGARPGGVGGGGRRAPSPACVTPARTQQHRHTATRSHDSTHTHHLAHKVQKLQQRAPLAPQRVAGGHGRVRHHLCAVVALLVGRVREGHVVSGGVPVEGLLLCVAAAAAAARACPCCGCCRPRRGVLPAAAAPAVWSQVGWWGGCGRARGRTSREAAQAQERHGCTHSSSTAAVGRQPWRSGSSTHKQAVCCASASCRARQPASQRSDHAPGTAGATAAPVP